MFLKTDVDGRIDAFIDTYVALRCDAGERILPRSNMTISAVADFARDITIVDLRSDDEWTICLNGTRHCDHACVDRTGRNVLDSCSASERALRLRLAESMFLMPCGMRASLIETFEDGQQATLETASLPLLGSNGGRKIVTYALLTQDIEEPFSERPTLSGIEIVQHRFVDLGFGTPARRQNITLWGKTRQWMGAAAVG